MREGDQVITVYSDFHNAYGRHMVLERGMRLHVERTQTINGVLFLGFEEIPEDDDELVPLFMASGFRPERLN